jgi:hypothetical protein
MHSSFAAVAWDSDQIQMQQDVQPYYGRQASVIQADFRTANPINAALLNEHCVAVTKEPIVVCNCFHIGFAEKFVTAERAYKNQQCALR